MQWTSIWSLIFTKINRSMLGLQLISHLWGRVYYYNIVYHEAARNRLSIFLINAKWRNYSRVPILSKWFLIHWNNIKLFSIKMHTHNLGEPMPSPRKKSKGQAILCHKEYILYHMNHHEPLESITYRNKWSMSLYTGMPVHLEKNKSTFQNINWSVCI